MECKLVRRFLDDPTLDVNREEFLEHMSSCDECRAYDKELRILEEDLKTLLNKSVDSSELNKTIIHRNRAIYKRNSFLVVVSVLILFISFSSEILTFAEKIPFIQDILDMLNHDEQVEYAIEKGYPVHEYASDNGEYILLVKDIYVDSIDFRMQFTLLDKEGNIAEGASLRFKLPGITKDSYEYPMISETPWQSFTIDIFKKIGQMEKFLINFELIDDGEVISFESVDVDISHMKTYKFEHVRLNEEVELQIGTAKIISIDIGPTAATVKYKMIEQYDCVETSLNIDLVDNKGQVYWSNEESWSSDSPVRAVKFEYSNLDDAVIEKVKITGYGFYDVESIGTIQDETMSFKYNDYEFTLNQFLDNRRDQRGRLTTDEVINAELFPNLCFKEKNNWVMASMCQQEYEYVSLTNETVEEALGDDYGKTDEETIYKLIDYMKREKNIELDPTQFLEYPLLVEGTTTVYIKTTKEFFVNNEEVQWKTSLSSEGLEFGVLGEYHYRELNEEIKVEYEK